MSGTATVDLRVERTWDLGRLLAEAFEWPVDWRTVPLGEIAAMIPRTASPTEGALVIAPGGLDARTGGIRRRTDKYLGNVYQVGVSERSLREGDLLVPPIASLPVLYVTPAMQGALVAGSFLALRAGADSLWLWGVLNSTEGKQLRATATTSKTLRLGQRAALLSLPIPRPPLSQLGRVEPALRDLITMTGADEEDAPTSWWRVADIRDTEWRLVLATSRPELLDQGVPLEGLARDIRIGRSVGSAPTNSPGPYDLPVADAGWLRSGKFRRWCAPDSPRAALRTEQDDVVMAVTGRAAHAQVAPAGLVIDTSVAAVTLHDPELSRGLAQFLNSRTGLGMRALRLTGSFITRLNLRDIRQLRVTDDVYSVVDRDGGLHSGAPPLEERLEQLLWV